MIFRDVKAQHRGSANFTEQPRALPCYRFGNRGRPETQEWVDYVASSVDTAAYTRPGLGPFWPGVCV